MLHLRSYRKALDVLRPIEGSTSNEDIQRLIRQLIVYVEENLTEEYDISAIVIETQQNAQLVHADYCSKDLELRTSMMVKEDEVSLRKQPSHKGLFLLQARLLFAHLLMTPTPQNP